VAAQPGGGAVAQARVGARPAGHDRALVLAELDACGTALRRLESAATAIA